MVGQEDSSLWKDIVLVEDSSFLALSPSLVKFTVVEKENTMGWCHMNYLQSATLVLTPDYLPTIEGWRTLGKDRTCCNTNGQAMKQGSSDPSKTQQETGIMSSEMAETL